MEISLEPEVTFRVGRIRASLWRKHIMDLGTDESPYWVTLSRSRTAPSIKADTSEALDANDIPQAILALKKAHDYIKKRIQEPPQEGFLGADQLINRIP